MDVGSLLLITAIIVLAVFVVSRPFYSGGPVEHADESHKGFAAEKALSELMGEKERLLNALRDLDADHDLEKVPDDVYLEQRDVLMQAAALNLKSIDELEQNSIADKQSELKNSEAGGAPSLSTQRDEVEDLIAERRRKRNEKSGGFCPHCGKVLQRSDRYCPSCGAKA
jgi:rubrerythrin